MTPTQSPRFRPFADRAASLPAPCALRPDLAAFFALKSRECTPARLTIEHGVLAQLVARRGTD